MTPPLPKKKYNIIYADPPWHYRTRLFGGRKLNYDLQSNDWLADLNIPGIAAKDSVLFLWVTMPKLPEIFPILEAWGFTYKTVAFTWIKTIKKGRNLSWGMGWSTRSNAEICILAMKGSLKRVSKAVHSVVISPVREHSRKPDEVRDLIVKLYGDLPRIELFARQKFKGWDCWGDQAPKELRKGLLD